MNAFELAAVLKLDSSQFDNGLRTAGNLVGLFGSGVASSLNITTLSIAGAVAALGAFAVSSVKTGAQFDQAMSQVAATMGKSMSEMENEVGSVDLAWGHFSGNLRDYAKEMGEHTAFSAIECAQALNYMALAGYDTQKSMEMLPNVLNLAAAGGMDLARASDMVTDTQTAFGLSTERTTQMVDEMAKAASTGNTSVEQLGDAFLVVGGLAKELNGGLVTLADGTQAPVDGVQELEIALTAMANAGVKGSEAGTHMRNMLLKLSSPTAEGTKQFEKLGVKVFDTNGQMRSLNDIFGDLNTSLSTLTQEEKIKAISELFNTRDMASAEALLGAVGQDWDKIGESILNAQGAAQKMADTQLDNLRGDITLFKSALEGTKIAISEGLTPALRTFVQTGTKMLGSITEFVKEHSDTITTILKGVANVIVGVLDVALNVLGAFFDFIENHSELAVAAITAIGTAFVALKFESVTSALLGYVTQFITGFIGALTVGEGAIGAFGTAWEAMTASMAANPIGLIVIALVGLVAAIGYTVYHFATMEEAVKSLDEAQKAHDETIRNLAQAQQDLFHATEDLEKAQAELANAEKETGLSGEELYNQFRNGTLTIQEMNEQQRRVVEAYIDLEKKQKDLKQTTEELATAEKEELIAGFQEQASAIKEQGGNYDELGQKMVQAYRDGKIGQDELQDNFAKIMTEMTDDEKAYFLQALPEDMRESTGIMATTQETFQQRWEHVWDDIKKFTTGTFGETMDDVNQHSTGTFGDVESTWSVIGQYFSDKFTEIKNAYEFVLSYWGQWFTDRKNDVTNTWNDIGDWFRGKFQNAWDNITSIFSWIGGWFGDKKNDVTNAFESVGGWFGDKFQEAYNNVTNAFAWIGGYFAGKWNEITSAFNISDALSWGSDMIDNFIKGIREKWDALKDTLKGIADTIAGYLKHSTPKYGPLADDDKWTVHMMDNLIGGIDKNKGKLKNSVSDIADIMAVPMTDTVDGFLGNYKSSARGYNQTINVYSPKSLTPYEVARQTRNATKNMILSMSGV